MHSRHFVVGTRQRFEHWCRENDHDPRSRDVVHVTRTEHVHGYRLTAEDEIVDLGTWEQYPLVVMLEGRRR